jgi:hypothetical protein
MFLVHNERAKLTASWLNALATALVTARRLRASVWVFGTAGAKRFSWFWLWFVSSRGSAYIGEAGLISRGCENEPL